MVIQSRTLAQIRESIGYALNDMALITATTTGDTASLIATYGFAKGGDDEYNGRQLIAITPSGAIVAGEKTYVSDFDSATWDASLAPPFTSSTTSGDIFELWKVFTYEEINDAINQTIAEVSGKALQIKETHTTFTEADKYLYDVLSSFTHLGKVEYVSSTGNYHLLDNCDTVWVAGSANVTVTADSTFEKVGNACVKAVEAGGSGANAILAYKAISSTDISDCDEVEFWLYSSIALTAGQLEIHLSSTAIIASAEETIDIPAMDAATWYKHSLSLANPHSDTAIISIGIYQVSDVGAFTFYVDEVEANKFNSKVFKELPIEYWDIAQGSTPYLMLTSSGLSLVGADNQLRLTGYQIPDLMTADTDISEIDPAYLIAKTTGRLLVSHAKSSYLDINDRATLASYWLGEAAKMEPGLTTSVSGKEVKA